jgi:hypothetical protein
MEVSVIRRSLRAIEERLGEDRSQDNSDAKWLCAQLEGALEEVDQLRKLAGQAKRKEIGRLERGIAQRLAEAEGSGELKAGYATAAPIPPRPTPTAQWCGIYKAWYEGKDSDDCPYCVPAKAMANDDPSAPGSIGYDGVPGPAE